MKVHFTNLLNKNSKVVLKDGTILKGYFVVNLDKNITCPTFMVLPSTRIIKKSEIDKVYQNGYIYKGKNILMENENSENVKIKKIELFEKIKNWVEDNNIISKDQVFISKLQKEVGGSWYECNKYLDIYFKLEKNNE